MPQVTKNPIRNTSTSWNSSKQYGIQLGLAEDIAKAAKDAAIEQARTSASDMFTPPPGSFPTLGRTVTAFVSRTR